VSASLITFPDLVLELSKLCQTNQSGYVHIVTEKNHKLCIGLLKGNIVSLQYRIYRGVLALENMLKIESCRYSFVADSEVKEDTTLPEDINQKG